LGPGERKRNTALYRRPKKAELRLQAVKGKEKVERYLFRLARSRGAGEKRGKCQQKPKRTKRIASFVPYVGSPGKEIWCRMLKRGSTWNQRGKEREKTATPYEGRPCRAGDWGETDTQKKATSGGKVPARSRKKGWIKHSHLNSK